MRELPILMNGAMVLDVKHAGKLPAVGLGLQRSIVAQNAYPLDAAGPGNVPGRLHVVEPGVVAIALNPPQIAIRLSLKDRPRAVPVISKRVRNAGRAEHHHVVTDGVDHG